MKFTNGLRLSLFQAHLPVGERTLHLFFSLGDCASGGVMLSIADARTLLAEMSEAIAKVETAQAVAKAGQPRAE